MHAPDPETSESPAPDQLARRRFRIMGTPSELLLRADASVAEPLFDQAVAELQRLEAELTRFVPQSPIERLNDAGGGRAWPELTELLIAAQQAWSDTDGRFDIAIGADLIAAGYDRDFDELDAPTPEQRAQWHAAPRTADRVLDWSRATGFAIEEDGALTINPGVRLDVGGIAKGWAADRIRDLLAPVGSCLVNLGGDIALHVADGDEPWPIGVELPDRTMSVAVSFGGVATSGQDRRRWRAAADGTVAHHVIDPAEGRPAVSDVLRITVIAATCAQAEVWTKALFMVGADRAQAEADQRAITAVIVDMVGAVRFSGSLAGA